MRHIGITFATLLMAGALAVPAGATLTITITDAASGTTTFTAVPANCSGGLCTLVATQIDNDFSVNIQVGTSNGPGGPAVLTLSGTVTKAASNAFGGAANQLTVAISDNGFLLPVGPGNLIQTVDTNSPAQTSTASGSLTASGFYSNTNTLFCQTSASCTGATPNASFSSYLVSNPGQTDTLPVPNFTAPFALDQVLTYNFTSQ